MQYIVLLVPFCLACAEITDKSNLTPDGSPIDAADAAVNAIDASIDAGVDAACINQSLLVNGDFDTGPGAEWVENSQGAIVIGGSDFPLTPHSGTYGAWLGGFTSATDSLHQSINIPAGTQSLRLAGQQRVATNEVLAGTWDDFSLELRTQNGALLETLVSLTNESDNTVWTSFDVALNGAYAGQAVQLYATSTNDVTDHTNFFLDSLVLSAVVCP